MQLPGLALQSGSGILAPLAILAVAIGIVGVAILLLFSKKKI